MGTQDKISHLDDPRYAQSELELDCGLRDLNWLYLRQFLTKLHQEFDERRNYVAYLATRWMTALDMVSSYEESVLLGGNPTEYEKTYFYACVAEVKSKGLHLLNLIQQNSSGFDFDKILGFSADDIASLVRNLEYTEGAVYRALAPAQKTELGQIFGAESRANP